MSAIPAPAMPPKRPSSSIQQVVTEARHDAEAGAASAPAEQGAGKATERTEPPSAAPAQRESITKPAAAAPSSAVSKSGRSGTTREQPATEMAKVARIQKPILLKLDENLKERMVNTMEWTSPRTGIRNQQVFIRRAIADLCERLEKEHNSGQPFPVIVDALEA